MFTQCCVDTAFAHSLYSYSSSLQWVKGPHSITFGGEQRQFFNNFFQPDNPTGIFNFTRDVTTQDPNGGLGDNNQGNPFATLLVGFPSPEDSQLHIIPSVADKSIETAFYVQDDWKVTPKLTLNLGLRYEWSTPYSENNQLQFSNLRGTRVSTSQWLAVRTRVRLRTNRAIKGNDGVRGLRTSQCPGGSEQLCSAPGIRVPAGEQHGAPGRGGRFLWNERGHQFPVRRAFVLEVCASVFHDRQLCDAICDAGKSLPRRASAAARQNLWQAGELGIRQQQRLGHGRRAMRKSTSGTTGAAPVAGTNRDRGGLCREPRYAPSLGRRINFRRERNFLPSSIREALVAQLNPHDPDSTAVSDFLATPVANPFQCFFATVAAPASYCPANPIFNPADVADSLYVQDQIPQGLLLHPYPQFAGGFSGLPRLIATSWYNSLQIRFQKRASHYISFEGNYTFSKSTDDSSAGRNAWLTNLEFDNPQLLDNLKAEHGISSNDAAHRLTGLYWIASRARALDWPRHGRPGGCDRWRLVIEYIPDDTDWAADCDH
jgi:hypothetical protein